MTPSAVEEPSLWKRSAWGCDLRAVGSDLNPVAILITKALIELPQEFQGRSPVNPDADPIITGEGEWGRNLPR